MYDSLKQTIGMKENLVYLTGISSLIILMFLIVIEYFLVKIKKPTVWLELKLFGILAVTGLALVLNNEITSTMAIIIMGTFICSERFLERISAIVTKNNNYFESANKTDIKQKIITKREIGEDKSIEIVYENIDTKSNLVKSTYDYLDYEKREHILERIKELAKQYQNSKLYLNFKMIKKKQNILYDSVLELENRQVVMFEIREGNIGKIGLIENDVSYMMKELRKYYGKNRRIRCVTFLYSNEEFEFYSRGDICILKYNSYFYDTFDEVKTWLNSEIG